MTEKKYILFDLDGTLTNPMEGITKSVQYALRSYGIDVPELKKLIPFIGPPLKDSFMKFYDFPEEQASEAIGRYREYFTSGGMFENAVYEGIPQLLQSLKDAGKVLYVATSKPEEFSKQILEHFGLAGYFDYVAGASMDERRVKKGDVIRYLMDTVGVSDTDRMVMVGDREHDVLGAKENGIDCVGVLFGYGSREELEQAGAYGVVESVEELKMWLLRE